MATYERSVVVRAPFDVVWDFHSSLDGLAALTPGWLDFQVESVRGPDGEPDPSVLASGSTVRLSVAPAGIGPRQHWTSRIVDREARPGAARFTDVLLEGPLPTWRHTHSFFKDGDATIVRDQVQYSLPFGRVSRLLAPVMRVGLATFFRYRHRRTKAILESR